MIKRKFTHGTISLALCVLITMFLVFEETLTEAARDTLHLSALHIIPALFPYMVISSVTVSLGLLDPICRFLPTRRLFHLPQSSASVIVTGMIGGFPTGAIGAGKLYESGSISREEASRVCALASCASPTFIIGTVGTLWGREYAVFLLVAQTVTAFIIAAILAIGKRSIPIAENSVKSSHPAPIRAVCSAISEGATSCVIICGYIVFFRVLITLIGILVPPLYEYAAAILEFSTGVITGASHGGIFGISITGFSVGFSGVSVFMQNANIISRHGIPNSPILVTKFIHGALLSLASAIYYVIFRPDAKLAEACTKMHSPFTPYVIVFVLFSAVIIYFFAHKKYFCRRS